MCESVWKRTRVGDAGISLPEVDALAVHSDNGGWELLEAIRSIDRRVGGRGAAESGMI